MSGSANSTPITITIKDLGLSCEASIARGVHAEAGWEDGCVAELEELGIAVDAALREQLTGLIESHMADPTVTHTVVLLSGTAPQHGKNGELMIFAKFDPRLSKKMNPAPAPAVSEDEGVDHRERSAFQLVEAGEQIGRLRHPTPGVDGVNVFGKPISAKDGKPAVVHTDETVCIQENGAIEAAVSGVVQVERKTIRVLRRLNIRGSVDYSTGHIDFPGDVVVEGGVKDQFRVVAEQDILVKKLVEAATLHAGRDMHLHGGAACREKGSLTAEGDVSARYLNECELCIGGDLEVHREIINSNVMVGGSLLSPRCTLIGGTTVVRGRCELLEAGAELGTPTRITLGGHPDAERLGEEARTLLKELSGRIKDSEMARERLLEQGAATNGELAEQVQELGSEIEAFNRLKGTLRQAASGMRQVVQNVACVDLLVRRLLWRRMRITLPEWDVVIQESLKGPLQITCEPGGAPILRDLFDGSAVELSTVADVRSRTEDQAADEALAA